MDRYAYLIRRKLRWSEKVMLRLYCFPHGTDERPRPHVVFEITLPEGVTKLYSDECYTKDHALSTLDSLLAMFRGDFIPEDIKGLRGRLRSRIRRYRCIPEFGRVSGGHRGSIGHSTGTH